MRFFKHIGIDYSGAGSPKSPQTGIRVFESASGNWPTEQKPASGYNWSRQDVALYLLSELSASSPVIIGIDHGFSYPDSFFTQNNLKNWDEFLSKFALHWPTCQQSIKDIRLQDSVDPWHQASDDLRLTERWTAGASSVRQFAIMNGNVAYSSHAGIGWLIYLRNQCRGNNIPLHFWPFDGWDFPAGSSVVVEMFPSIIKRRLDCGEIATQWKSHQLAAYAMARWLSTTDNNDFLDKYCSVILTASDKAVAQKEGWIYGLL